jgi:hypothetical protein
MASLATMMGMLPGVRPGSSNNELQGYDRQIRTAPYTSAVHTLGTRPGPSDEEDLEGANSRSPTDSTDEQ